MVLILAVGVCAQTPPTITIDTIEIQGLTRVGEPLIRSQLESREGEPISRRAIARDIRRLSQMGYFTNIEAHYELRVGTNVLIYKFTEEKTIGELVIVGNKKLKDRDVRSALNYQEGEPFFEEAFESERFDLLDMYKDKGFLNATVDIVVEELDNSRMRVSYLIEEGRKARVKKVKFSGNESLSNRKLRRTVKTGNGFLFISGKYKEEKFNTDLENIVGHYGDIGHLEAEIISTDFEYFKKGKRVLITINLFEGPEYTIANLDLDENFVFTDPELYQLIEVNPGDVHNKSQVAKDALAIESQYSDNGYVNARVNSLVTLDYENHTTNIIHHVVENDLKYIRELIITGNSDTKDEVARRHIVLTPGDRFDGSDLRYSVNELNRSQLFGEVRPSLEDFRPDDRFVNLLMDVDEGKTGNFNFGVGLNSDTGVGGFGELRLNNFDISNPPSFTGGGQIFTANASIGEYYTGYRIGFTDPEFMGYPFSFGVDLFDDESESRGGSEFTIKQQGARIRLGKRLSTNITVQTYFGFADVSIDNLDTFVDPKLRELEDDGTSHTWGWSFIRNTANHYLDPTDGTRFQFNNEWAGLGGDNEYVKFQTDITLYYGIKKFEKMSFLFNNRNGYAIPLGDKKFVPLSARFFAGGGSTVRGYDNRDVGPRAKTFQRAFGRNFFDKEAVGGEFRILNTLEAKYKLNDIMRLYTFADGGGLWFDIDDFEIDDFKYSVGIGVGLQVPFLGPLRIDYGFPLNPDDHQGSGRLHLQSLINF